MGYKWRPNKAAAMEFAEKMEEIEEFCKLNEISKSFNSNSYYFSINGQFYRVSNHTIEQSNKNAFNEFGEQIREQYHNNFRNNNTIYIHASKTRIIEIYNNLKNGVCLDGKGKGPKK